MRSARFQEVDCWKKDHEGERGQNEKRNCSVKWKGDAAQGPVVKAKKAPSAPSLDEWEGHLAAAHAEYRGWCPFCVAGRGKSEAHRRSETSRDHGHPNFIWIALTWQRGRGQSIANSGGQVLGGSLVDHTPCALQGYSAPMDRSQACERRDHVKPIRRCRSLM